MACYRRTEMIRHPESLHERTVKVELFDAGELDFEAARESLSLFAYKPAEATEPDFVEVHYPWHQDYRQTVIVRYERREEGVQDESAD